RARRAARRRARSSRGRVALSLAHVEAAGAAAAHAGSRVNGPALVVAAGAVVLAALAAAADGALLGGDPEPEPPAPTVGRLRPGEAAHRALSLARVLAHLAAGAAIARGLDLSDQGGPGGVLAMIAAALVTVMLVEG